MASQNKYDDAYDATLHMAKVKMVMNSHKGNIEDNDPKVMIALAKQELDELEAAIESGNYLNIIEEVADVLNFSIAASHNALQKYRGRKDAKDTGHTKGE